MTGARRRRRREEKLMVNYSNGTDPFLEVGIEVRDHRGEVMHYG